MLNNSVDWSVVGTLRTPYFPVDTSKINSNFFRAMSTQKFDRDFSDVLCKFYLVLDQGSLFIHSISECIGFSGVQKILVS